MDSFWSIDGFLISRFLWWYSLYPLYWIDALLSLISYSESSFHQSLTSMIVSSSFSMDFFRSIVSRFLRRYLCVFFVEIMLYQVWFLLMSHVISQSLTPMIFVFISSMSLISQSRWLSPFRIFPPVWFPCFHLLKEWDCVSCDSIWLAMGKSLVLVSDDPWVTETPSHAIGSVFSELFDSLSDGEGKLV